MNTDAYLLKVNDQISGPHTIVALREMASIHAFNDEAMVSPIPPAEQSWIAIKNLPELRIALFSEGKKFNLKSKPVTVINTPSPDGPIQVESMLKDNVTWQRTTERPISDTGLGNRRRRDYAVAFLFFNLIAGAAYYWLPHNPLVLASLGAYLVIINIGLYWVFYQIMDRY